MNPHTERKSAAADAQPTMSVRMSERRADARPRPFDPLLSLHPVFSGPAPGLAGARVAFGTREQGAERSDLRIGPIAKRASVMRSMPDMKPAIPGHGKGPPRV